MTILGPDQVRQLLASVAGTVWHDVFYLGFYTGLRRGELLGLRWQDIDFDQKKLYVKRSIHRVNGKLEVRAPKTGQGRRTVALSPSVCDLLRDRRGRLLLGGLPTGDSDYVFTEETGEPYDPDSATHYFLRAIAKAGLPSCRFHDMRHTHVGLLILQGVPPKVISERVGHSSIGITMNLYGHLMPGMEEQAALKIQELLTR